MTVLSDDYATDEGEDQWYFDYLTFDVIHIIHKQYGKSKKQILIRVN